MEQMLIGLFCTPTGRTRIGPEGQLQGEYMCPPILSPFVGPEPEDIELPEIDIPGISRPGNGEENITDDPEEGQTVGPIIPAENDGTVTQTQPEPGSLAADADGPVQNPDLPSPNPEVKRRIDEDAQDDECTEGCDECPPRLEGIVDWRTYIASGVDETNSDSYIWPLYQTYVCRLPNDPGNGRIKEFIYLTDDRGQPYPWDGFEPGSCTLIEAKYAYDTKLSRETVVVTGSTGQPDPRFRTVPAPGEEFVVRMMFAGLVNQARAQLGRISGVTEAKLLWAFSSYETQDYFFWNGGNSVGNRPKFRMFTIPWEAP